MTDDQNDSNGRVGFRDIYRAVGESEARIVAALNAAIHPLTVASTDHEARLRFIEGAVAPMAVTAVSTEKRLASVESVTGAIVQGTSASLARREGAVMVFTTGQKVLAAVVAVGSLTMSAIALLAN